MAIDKVALIDLDGTIADYDASLIGFVMKDRDKRSDMLKLADAFFQNLERGDAEYGGWGLDDKRPFGNSDVDEDIMEILGMDTDREEMGERKWEAQSNYVNGLYDELGKFLEAEWAAYRGSAKR